MKGMIQKCGKRAPKVQLDAIWLSSMSKESWRLSFVHSFQPLFSMLGRQQAILTLHGEIGLSKRFYSKGDFGEE